MIDKWANITFSDALERIEFEEKVKSTLKKSNFFEQIKNRLMDGTSVENIVGINERDRGQFRFRMSDMFHESMIESVNDTPIRYILKTTQKLIEEGQSNQQLSGNLGRAYRSFASFLRDYDAYNKIQKIIDDIKEDFEINVQQNAELDARFHADVLIKCQDKDNFKMKFIIWLYQKTERSLDKISDRISGNRGKIPIGIHVLAPIKTDIIEIIKKKEKQLEKTKKYLENTLNELTRKEKNPRVLNKTIRKLKAKCSKYKYTISKIEHSLKYYEEDKNKIEDVKDWLLYSSDYLRSVINECISIFKKKKLPVMNYNIVQEKFSYPRKVLSSVFMFYKPIDIEHSREQVKLLIELENSIPIDKISKIVECTYSDILEIIAELQKENVIDGYYANRLKFNFTTEINIVIDNLINKIEKL